MIQDAPASGATDVSALLLAVSHAQWRERVHQQRCRARAEWRECQACLDYEATWLAADDALTAFLKRRRAQEALVAR